LTSTACVALALLRLFGVAHFLPLRAVFTLPILALGLAIISVFIAPRHWSAVLSTFIGLTVGLLVLGVAGLIWLLNEFAKS
jgi:hypothetical protein